MDGLKKIHVLPLGQWLGHPAGSQNYGVAEAQYIVDRANRLIEESGNPIQIDYEHASLNPPADGAPASGWMHSFVLEDDGVYAFVEWTERASDMIKNGEYKYISPVISPAFPDPVTGETIPIELFNAGITNQPFMHDKIKQLAASALESRRGEGNGSFYYLQNARQLTIPNNTNGGTNMDLKESVDAILAASPLPDGSTPDDLINYLKKAGEMLALMPGAPADETVAPDMDAALAGMTRLLANSKTLDDIREELELKEDDNIVSRIAALKTNADTKTDVQKEIDELRAYKQESEIRNLIADNDNRIPPAKRDHVRAFAQKHGLDAAKEYVEELPELPDNTQSKPIDNSKEVDETRLALAKKQGISPELIRNSINRKQED